MYKHNRLDRNAPVLLYKLEGKNKILLGQWFLTSFSVCNYTSVQFTANDAMMFTDNPYPMMGYQATVDPDWEEGDPPLPMVYTSLTVGEQFKQAEAVIKTLTGITVNIDMPNKATFYTTGDETSWSIRTLMSNSAMLDAVNYYCTSSEPEVVTFKQTGGDYNFIGADEYSAPWVGVADTQINRVLLLTHDREYPELSELQNDDPDTEEDEAITPIRLGVYSFTGNLPVTSVGTLKLVDSLVPAGREDVLTNKELQALIGKSFGTEFNCANVKVEKFLTPFHQLDFELTDGVFYVTSATYKLTVDGLYASVSGSGRSLSDAQYAGKTEKTLRTKLSLNARYGDTIVSNQTGIYWTDSNTTIVNEG